MTIKEKVNSSGSQELKQEFKAIRDELIEQGKITHAKFEKYVIDKDPQFSSDNGKKKIFDVYYGRASSLHLLLFLQDFQTQLS